MIYEFKIDSTPYFFNGESLKLFKDFIPENSEKAKSKSKDKNFLYQASIIVANACNGNCVYCYQDGGNFSRKSVLMDKCAADEIISLLSKSFKTVETISFFGGEATLNFEIIQYIVQQLEKKISIHNYEITTNASIITKDMIDFFVDHDFKIIVSIDGPEYIHDKLRLNCPYSHIINVIHQLKNTKIGSKMVLNCTYTKYHQKNIDYNQLVSFFENLGVSYYITNVITDIDWLKLPENLNDIEQQKQDIDRCYENIYSNNLNKNMVSYCRDVIRSLINQVSQDSFCCELFQDSFMFFDYNGEQIPCIGYLDKNISRSEINKFNSKSTEKCSSCWAKNLCTNCIVDISDGIKNAPYLNSKCLKEELYAYSLKKLVEIFHYNPEKFQCIIDNFCTQ